MRASIAIIQQSCCDVAQQAALVRINNSESAAASGHNVAVRICKLRQEHVRAWSEASDGHEAAMRAVACRCRAQEAAVKVQQNLRTFLRKSAQKGVELTHPVLVSVAAAVGGGRHGHAVLLRNDMKHRMLVTLGNPHVPERHTSSQHTTGLPYQKCWHDARGAGSLTSTPAARSSPTACMRSRLAGA